MLCQQTSPKRWFANVNMTSNCDVKNSAYPATMTTIRQCSTLEFGKGTYNQAVAPGITRQGCQIGRFGAKFRKFGRISSWLAVRFLAGSLAFFWPFCKRHLAENFLCWPFLKICVYFKASKLSTATPFLKVWSPVCAFRPV